MTKLDLVKLDDLIEQYGHACSCNNEYDNRSEVASAKRNLVSYILGTPITTRDAAADRAINGVLKK